MGRAQRRLSAVAPEQLAAAWLGEVRGQGLLLALELGRTRSAAGGAAREIGLLLNAPRPSVLRFMPALNVSDAEIDTWPSVSAACSNSTASAEVRSACLHVR